MIPCSRQCRVGSVSTGRQEMWEQRSSSHQGRLQAAEMHRLWEGTAMGGGFWHLLAAPCHADAFSGAVLPWSLPLPQAIGSQASITSTAARAQKRSSHTLSVCAPLPLTGTLWHVTVIHFGPTKAVGEEGRIWSSFRHQPSGPAVQRCLKEQ